MSISMFWHLATSGARSYRYQFVCEILPKFFFFFFFFFSLFFFFLINFQDSWVFSLVVTFWLRHCLGQGKVTFGKSFVWILSILMCIKKIIKIFSMIEDLRQFRYLHIFLLWRCLGQTRWQFASVLAIFCRYLSVRQTISKYSQRAIFAN